MLLKPKARFLHFSVIRVAFSAIFLFLRRCGSEWKFLKKNNYLL